MMGQQIDTDDAIATVAVTFFFSEVAETRALAVPVAKADAFVGKNDRKTNQYQYR